MKPLLALAALLLCFTINAQNSFKIKKGSVLTYEIEEDTTHYNLIVTIENVSPMKLSYTSTKKNRKGTLVNSIAKADDAYDYDFFMPIPISKPIPKGTATGLPVMLSKVAFENVYKLNDNFRNGVENDTATAAINFARKGVVPFWAIGFQQEDVLANGTDLQIHTFAIDEKTPGKEDEDFTGYLLRVSIDREFPYVTYISDIKNKFSVHLKEAKNVELYEYVW